MVADLPDDPDAADMSLRKALCGTAPGHTILASRDPRDTNLLLHRRSVLHSAAAPRLDSAEAVARVKTSRLWAALRGLDPRHLASGSNRHLWERRPGLSDGGNCRSNAKTV